MMNFHDPRTTVRVIGGLESYLEKHGIADVNELIGAVHD
jgi:dihydroorotate dehydrogenase (NAD+) catalytic subunit